MRLTLLSCDVLTREVCREAAASPHVIGMRFTPLDSHDQPGILRAVIQQAIDEADGDGSEAVLLGYGLCGNAVNGLQARSKPLVIPRAHDCCTLFLGSKALFNRYFADHPSASWSCVGYMERSNGRHKEAVTGKMPGTDGSFAELVEQYGEENAKYVWETLHPPERESVRFYISLPTEGDERAKEAFVEEARADGKEVRVLSGNAGLIRDLLRGEWNEEDFLIVPPGGKITAMYDREEIIRADTPDSD